MPSAVIGCLLVFIGVVVLTLSKPFASSSESTDTKYRGPVSASDIATGEDSQDYLPSSPSHSDFSDLALASAGVKLSAHPPPQRSLSHNRESTSTNGKKSLRQRSSFGTFPLSSSLDGAPTMSSRTGHALATAKPFSPGYLLIAGGSYRERVDKADVARKGEIDVEGNRRDLDPSSNESDTNSDGDEAIIDEVGNEALEMDEDSDNRSYLQS